MKDRQFGRVRFICGENGGKYPFNHSLYLQGDNERVVIDPACSLEKLTPFGSWYGDVFSSIADTISSIHRLKAVPARRWMASHDQGVYESNPGPLWDRYEKIIYEREDKLLAFLNRPKTQGEICAAWLIYGRPREPKEVYEFNERVLIGKHLDDLRHRGKVVCEDGRWRKAVSEI